MSIIEKMIIQLKSSRESMSRQINSINEIAEKSNNLILYLEAQRAKECETNQNFNVMKPYSFNKEMEPLLAKSIEIYERLSRENLNKSLDQETTGIVEFLQRNKQNNQYLSNNVRKTLVISDIMEKVTLDDVKKLPDNEN